MIRKRSAFTLVELTVYIIVVAIVLTGILASFSVALRKIPESGQTTRAVELAQERMELILGQRSLSGFANMIDLCSQATPPVVCTTVPSEYQVEATDSFVDTNKKVIKVIVKDSDGGTILDALDAFVMNY